MSQSIALQARYTPIDLPGAVAAGQQARARDIELQNAPMRSELERLKLQDDIGAQSALEQFRTDAAEHGPENALDAVKAYPEIQADLDKKMGDLPPDQRRAAVRRAKAFGNAARYVMAFPDGSEEQKQAWATSLQVLREDGYIDDDTFNAAMKSGPNRLLLNEALTVEEFTKKYADPGVENDKRITDARVGEYENRNKNRDTITGARVEDIGTDNERADEEAGNRMSNRDSRTGALNEQGDARVGIMRDKANKVQDVKPPKAAGSKGDPTAAALKRVDKIAEAQGIDYGSQEYEDLKRRVFEEMKVGQAGAPAQTGMPEGATESKTLNGKTYYRVNGQWMVAE